MYLPVAARWRLLFLLPPCTAFYGTREGKQQHRDWHRQMQQLPSIPKHACALEAVPLSKQACIGVWVKAASRVGLWSSSAPCQFQSNHSLVPACTSLTWAATLRWMSAFWAVMTWSWVEKTPNCAPNLSETGRGGNSKTLCVLLASGVHVASRAT